MSPLLPRVGSVIEISLDGPGGRIYRSRLEDVEGGRLSVTLPPDPRLRDVGGLACAATVRWSAGPRGSASAPARLSVQAGTRADTRPGATPAGAGADTPAGTRMDAPVDAPAGVPASLQIELIGPVTLEQNRRFVRGGGFETIELRRENGADRATYTGWVADLSEASVCGRFPDLHVEVGESVWVRLDIDGTDLSELGQVLRTHEGPVAGTTSVVVGYRLGEAHASAIRRYLLRQQALIRSRRHNR